MTQVVIRSPTVAIGFDYRHTSERIFQRYYMRPANLMQQNCNCGASEPHSHFQYLAAKYPVTQINHLGPDTGNLRSTSLLLSLRAQ